MPNQPGPDPVRPEYMVRADALLEGADLIASKDHRNEGTNGEHDTGWCHALNEAEHDLRQHARQILDEAEGVQR